ncbi:hypothetical protein M7775_05490 [Sporomusa sphaeroides DSM 2875]|uniref:hypothetical protein n=1 Tax=Sporomusa sphaeroides TaxID=47679 RepID=UPI00202F4F81|nr:hypothetical protein [Sporomusa sphaeroides]MCM0758029.1 hypothetical protein [Sporomusa sphaeroides DSM 2875]
MQSLRICILIQTATDLSNYYKQLFVEYDIYFITFKRYNAQAIDFMPNSTWSEGRNRLWQHVKDQYDYYLFLDDDLEFSGLSISVPPFIENALEEDGASLYQYMNSQMLRELFYDKLTYFDIQVATFRNFSNDRIAFEREFLKNNLRIRPVGWFDAQATLFSNFAANLLLPYDTLFSGWHSAQIPIYTLAHFAFGAASVSIIDIACNNLNHTQYREDYNSVKDCRKMVEWLKLGINYDYEEQYLIESHEDRVNLCFAQQYIKQNRVKLIGKTQLMTSVQCFDNISKYFDIKHAYFSERQSNFRKSERLNNI